MNLSATELTVLGTISGTFIGGLFGFLGIWISKRYEERKSFNELIMRIASEQHKTEIDAAIQKGGGWVQPYHIYLINTLQAAKLVNKWFLTPTRMKRLLRRQSDIVGIAIEYAKNKEGK